MRLGEDDVASGISLEVLRRRWRAFFGEHDHAVAWNQSSLDLARAAFGELPATVLKGVYCNRSRGVCGTLDEVVMRERLAPRSLGVRGRAGERLGNALALVAKLSDVTGRRDRRGR
jgi:hypothetical protein